MAIRMAPWPEVTAWRASPIPDSSIRARPAFFARALGAGAYSVNDAAIVTNSGSISASASGSGYATAVGVAVESPTYWAVVENEDGGSIDASADSYDGAQATGVYAIGYGVEVYNAGAISASAEAGAEYGGATATGVFAAGTFAVDFSSASGSSIEASASGYYAYATGLFVAGYNYVDVDNGGDIDAYASGVYGSATGMQVLAFDDVAVYNSGDITAEFDGFDGSATGVAVYSLSESVYFYNSGTITATNSSGPGVGVFLASGHYTELFNHGTITADLAVVTGASIDEIWNYGTINGAVDTGWSNDVFYNAEGGEWNASGASYFGGGDDLVLNYGTINMSDAAIYMGTYSEYGNGFLNAGTITVSGDNLIDMGGGLDEVIDTLIPSLNPLPFTNYGVIDFVDGHPDDTLTIVGDFAGDGDIDVDVSAIHEASDLLYIDGSVVDGTTTIDPVVHDTPTSEFTEIPVVYVSGISGATNFALGDVDFDTLHTFLTYDFTLLTTWTRPTRPTTCIRWVSR